MGPIEDIMSILHVPKKGRHKITLDSSYLHWDKEQWSDLLRKKNLFDAILSGDVTQKH